ncbi:hypothetical protein FRZ67_00860 [Panacibacter ginsenosidivorans]|uniref:Tetratricopeptide repeat protein n=1 Tax=Panacibacter ginsenosidivorans TaxID=1813871 RepID=A0A5B8V3B8_9BACT|nr:hypothetical protein [Panacibacter ginsenosidivorans]QEC65920.1 hypothetical protein FRZ67_00860 [Panacibacter ginsenosidivorans]
MKKVFLSLVLAFFSLWVAAQYNAVTLYYSTGKIEDAKKEVDKLMADPKTKDKAETYIWKINVYSELYADSSLTTKYPSARVDAFEALNTYVTKEPDLKLLKEQGGRAMNILYGNSFNSGRSAFTAKDWNKAYDNFAFCQQVSEFIGAHGLNTNGKYTIDTTVVLYTAYSAQNAGKSAEAATRYKALADWKINDKEYEDIYKFILDYDTKQKDNASFQKYLAIAKEVFPGDASLWNQFEMNYMTNNTGLDEIISKYKTEDATGKLTEDGYITYAESFAMPDKAQADKLDSAQQVQLKLTAADAFAKAYNLNNKAGLYAFNTGVLYYNIFSALDDRFYAYTGESPAFKAKRAEIVKEQQDYAAKSIEWLEKGYTALKAKDPREKSENNSLNRCVTFLANLYMWKRDKSRGVNPKDYDAFDTKYQFYDGEVDKYK